MAAAASETTVPTRKSLSSLCARGHEARGIRRSWWWWWWRGGCLRIAISCSCAPSRIKPGRPIPAGRSPSRHAHHYAGCRDTHREEARSIVIHRSRIRTTHCPALAFACVGAAAAAAEAMARAPGGVRRRSARRDAAGGGDAVRKGPWTAEEDEVLLQHVRAHGPMDWSSIRSKGLLPRTGKSCRLRWVNKLRPNLKSGCKFSAEEERVVIELQSQFGNKWARIATYLQGRTDNDVKNFWSTRQKRLARLLRAPLPARSNKQNSSKGKAPSSSSLESPTATTFHQGPACLDQASFEGNSFGCHYCEAAPFMEHQNVARAPYDQACSGFFAFEGALPLQFLAPADGEASSSNAAHQLAPPLPFDPPLYPLVELPGWTDRCVEAGNGFVDAGAMDDLAYQELLPMVQAAPMMMPFFGMECAHEAIKGEPRDAFGDLPPNMFDDNLDQLPSSPPSPPSPSGGDEF
uniref:Uncharacterized protein n=1 Tax=Oryza brachyantha TaxID=4533 RepID=J3M056_ORYBR